MKTNKTASCASSGACEGTECSKCAICLDTCTGADTTGCGRCQARFHAKCLDSWVALKVDKGFDGTCPACRAVLVNAKDGDYASGESLIKNPAPSSHMLLPATSSASQWFYDDDDVDYDEEAAMQARILNQTDMFGNTHWDGDLSNVDSCEWDYADGEALYECFGDDDYGYGYAQNVEDEW